MVGLTNVSLAGAVTVVVGFGNVGRGVAERARGMGAQVLVTEIDPFRALEAHTLGYRVLPLADAAAEATLLITATGSRNVVRAEHLGLLPDGAILANAGHGSVEIDTAALAASGRGRRIGPDVEEYTDDSGRRTVLLASGNPVNTTGGSGHAAAAMDVSFSAQALAVAELVTRRPPPGLHELSEATKQEVARLAVTERYIPLDDPAPGHDIYSNYLTGEPERAALDTWEQ